MKLPEPKQNPSGTWRIQVTVGGRRLSITKRTPQACIKEAERVVILHEEGIERHKLASVRLGDAIDEYIEARSNVLSPSTIRGYKKYRNHRFAAYMHKPISQIDWQKMINAEAKLDLTPKTIKNAWGIVKSAIGEYGLNPTVRLPAPNPKEKEWLTPEQIPVFLDAIRDQKVELGALLALSGLRRSEIYGLTWDDVDLERKELHIHQGKVFDEDDKVVVRKQNKTASSTRTVPIFIDRLYDCLCAVPDKNGYVITYDLSRLRKRILRVCEKAGLPKVGVHGLRHSFCSLCYHKGISEKACMELGGWSDYQTMRKIYTHISEADKQAATDTLTSFFGALSEHTDETPTQQSVGAQAS